MMVSEDATRITKMTYRHNQRRLERLRKETISTILPAQDKSRRQVSGELSMEAVLYPAAEGQVGSSHRARKCIS